MAGSKAADSDGNAAGQLAAVVMRLRAAGCVFAEDEARLLIEGAATPADLAWLVDRRAAGFPLEHVLGWAEFGGLRIAVGPGAFVPRRRSEFLVSQAIAAVRQRPAGEPAAAEPVPVVVDLCCGTGAVGLAVVAGLDRAGPGQAELYAADIDPGALVYARRNLAGRGGHVYEGDLYDPLPLALRGKVDVLVVNAPYVPTSEIGLMPPEARLHEPRVALDGGIDGVGIHRRVAADAAAWLAPRGSLLIETSGRQAPLTAAAMMAGGLATRIASDDELGATVVIGFTPQASQRVGLIAAT